MKNVIMRLVLRPFCWAASLLALTAIYGQPTPSGGNSPEPKNQAWTKRAWESLAQGKWTEAIDFAQKCIDEFGDDATDMQKVLIDEKAHEPPIGNVADPTEKAKIFDRGPLNDVCACYYIQGEAFQELASREKDEQKTKDLLKKSVDAYGKAAGYKFARTWDPNGWFWSPAKKAEQRKRKVEKLLKE